jgi:hypothetical protein
MNENLEILETGGDWDTFAKANGGEKATSDAVIGTSLLSHVAGDQVKMYVRALFQNALLSGQPITRPYRCDSPELRRDMELLITTEANGTLLVQHTLLNERPLPHRLNLMPDLSNRRYAKRCSMCAFILLDGIWNDPAELDASCDLHVYFGVCDRCRGHRS